MKFTGSRCGSTDPDRLQRGSIPLPWPALRGRHLADMPDRCSSEVRRASKGLNRARVPSAALRLAGPTGFSIRELGRAVPCRRADCATELRGEPAGGALQRDVLDVGRCSGSRRQQDEVNAFNPDIILEVLPPGCGEPVRRRDPSASRTAGPAEGDVGCRLVGGMHDDSDDSRSRPGDPTLGIQSE